MRHIDRSDVRRTSVTLRSSTHLLLQAAVSQLNERGVEFSEQRVMRECMRICLKFWRGRKDIAQRNKKYNNRIGPYEIVPLYTTEALRSVAWVRCHHAGISYSRMLDFAISHYLPRVLELFLSSEFRGRDKVDAAVWRARYAVRRNTGNFVISYSGFTQRNDGILLDYQEKSEIKPWPPPYLATL